MRTALHYLIAHLVFLFVTTEGNAQVPTCGSNVPYFLVNLTGQPGGTWVSPLHNRIGNCCGTISPDNCSSFEILLDTGTAMINFEIASGAIPTGAMFYQINCGPQVPVGQPICLTGVGPHYLTFCKPGNNTNTYRITAIPKPIFPVNSTTRIGCSFPLSIMGLNTLLINSIYPGTTGQYNSYMSCTNCMNPTFTPAPNSPPYIDYLFCGTPVASDCGYTYACDTVRMYVMNPLSGNANPNPAMICAGGTVTMTGYGTGGDGNYTFSWTNSSNTIVGTNASYTANSQGTYYLSINDGLASPTCPAVTATILVNPDTGPPTISCPPPATFNTNAGTCVTSLSSISLGNPVTSDNCTISSVTNNAPANFPIGLTTITWTVTDANGNSSSCNQEITIVDNQAPVISSCAPPISVNANAGQCYATGVMLGMPSVSDNCGLVEITNNAPSSYPIGTTTVTWTITDLENNSITCTQNVTVTDNQAPVFTSCPSNINVNNNPNVCGAVVTYTPPAGTDNCSGSFVTLISGLPSGSTFPVGITTVVHSLTDASGNSVTCSFTVTVNDTQAPSITCPSNRIGNATAGLCSRALNTVNMGTPVVSDNCGIASVVNNAPTIFPVGVTVVTWTVTDIYGNTKTCTQNVTIIDNQPPVISSCAPPVNVVANSGSCNATGVTLGNPSATDNCGIASVTNNAPANFPVGTTTVTWTITDVNGNSSTCTQTVTVNDSQSPSFTNCTNNTIVVFNNPNVCGATVSYSTPVGTDNCSGVSTTMTSGLSSGSVFPVGTTTVTYVATDAAGNSATCSFNITVIDAQAPSITCPPTVIVNASPGSCSIPAGNVTLGNPARSDNCGIASLTNNAPSSFNVGTTVVTWTVTDVNGNTSSCNQNVIVRDLQPPVISSCAPPVSVAANAGSCNASNVVLGNPVVTDNCGVSTITNNAPGVFPIGTTTVTWTITDVNGNSITCTQSITVFDSQPPTFSVCTGLNITQTTDPGMCSSVVNFATPVGTDNCSGSVTTLTAGYSSGTAFPIGSTDVIYTVTDAAGNTATCFFNVFVRDLELPQITCPSDISMNADSGSCTADSSSVQLGTPIVSDNCGIASITNNAPSVYPAGATIVTWTVTDVNNNVNTCEQTVIIADGEGPSIVECAPDIVVASDPGECRASDVDLGFPLVTDNCEIPLVTNDAPAIFPVGVTHVTWTASDATGNTSTCIQVVTVIDAEAPLLVGCPMDIFSCDSLINYTVPTATDNCGAVSSAMISGLAPGSYFPVGTTTVSYLFTDINGNTSTCSFNVTVHPVPELNTISTNVNCNGNNNGAINLEVNSGTSPFTYSWSHGALTEDVSSLSPGNYDVLVTDINGCSAQINASITEPLQIQMNEMHGDVTCFGFADGFIDVTITGGTPPFSYQWNNGNTTEDVTVLCGGDYILQVTDNNGCLQDIAISVFEPAPLTGLTFPTPTICASNSGAIDLSVSGGNGNYNFSWSTGLNSEDLTNVSEGIFTVTISDVKGCSVSVTDTVRSMHEMRVIAAENNVRCNGESNGMLDINILNATEPVSILWSNGATTEDIFNLPAGTYSVTVTDSNNCVVSQSFVITEPEILSPTLNEHIHSNGFNISTYGGSNGAIEVIVNGGAEPYTYLWSTGSEASFITGLTTGTYSVTVTDANSCTRTLEITLEEPLPLAMPTGYSPNSDGNNDLFVVKGIDAYPENEIQVYNRWGNIVYTSSGYQNEWDGKTNSGDELPDGTYFVILTIKTDDIVLTGYVDMRRTR
jgi:gliding motility-associated-like protein